MSYSKDAYRELEDIMGVENVSDDPSILYSCAFAWLAELVRPDQSHYMPRPCAVIMTASTEEVQAITKVRIKYKMKIKPIPTDWYHWAGPIKNEDDKLPVDLHRMNRILEIDEKNMYAIVEPYVICAQLQAAVMKRGLNINIIDAVASTSIVDSACAYAGMGLSPYFMGT